MVVDNHTHSDLLGDGGSILSSGISMGPLGAAYARLGARGVFDYITGGKDMYHLKLGNNMKPESNNEKLAPDKPGAAIILEHSGNISFKCVGAGENFGTTGTSVAYFINHGSFVVKNSISKMGSDGGEEFLICRGARYYSGGWHSYNDTSTPQSSWGIAAFINGSAEIPGNIITGERISLWYAPPGIERDPWPGWYEKAAVTKDGVFHVGNIQLPNTGTLWGKTSGGAQKSIAYIGSDNVMRIGDNSLGLRLSLLGSDVDLNPSAGGRVNLASASTSGTAGSLAGYFEIKILGTRYKVPYYNL